MNPICSSEMIEGMIGASLSAMTFEMILNLKLAIAIGLYWSIDEAFGTFGRSAIILDLYPGKIQLEVKNSKTALITLSLIISQYV
jgi:hypothetical protein